jgi:hypothetical protein
VKPGPAPLLPFPISIENAEPSTLGGEGDLHTRFADLLIGYTADEYLNLPNLQPTSGASETAEYGFEEVSDDKELFFAANCLLKDSQKIRDLLQVLWTKYEMGPSTPFPCQ